MPGRAPVRFNVPSGDLTIVGHVWTAAEGNGTAMLLHGGGQTRQSWGPAAAILARRGWTAVVYDARGHGESGWSPSAAYGVDDGVRDLRAVAQLVGAERPVLIGASLGGVTSLLAAGEDAGFARALVLVDVVPRIEAAGVERISAFMTGRTDGFASLREAAEAVRDYTPNRSRPVNEAGLHKNLRQRTDGRWYWHWDPAWLFGRRSGSERAQQVDRLRAAAASLRIPALLLRGTESDIVGDEGVADLLALNPGIQVRDVPGTGHMVAGDDNTAFGEALLTFLDELGPARSRPEAG